MEHELETVLGVYVDKLDLSFEEESEEDVGASGAESAESPDDEGLTHDFELIAMHVGDVRQAGKAHVDVDAAHYVGEHQQEVGDGVVQEKVAVLDVAPVVEQQAQHVRGQENDDEAHCYKRVTEDEEGLLPQRDGDVLGSPPQVYRVAVHEHEVLPNDQPAYHRGQSLFKIN